MPSPSTQLEPTPPPPPIPGEGWVAPSHWLALVALTESDRPAEWPWIMQVVLHRVRGRGFPDTVADVVLQPWQFSFFNRFTRPPGALSTAPPLHPLEIFRAARAAKGLTGSGAWDEMTPLERQARDCAKSMLELPGECALLPRGVVNYWSPRSMIPAGALPRGWKFETLFCFTVPGIAAWRFVFAETVEARDTRAGNAERYRFPANGGIAPGVAGPAPKEG